jgi:hypothetical protein
MLNKYGGAQNTAQTMEFVVYCIPAIDCRDPYGCGAWRFPYSSDN